jgi:hypothetical protein
VALYVCNVNSMCISSAWLKRDHSFCIGLSMLERGQAGQDRTGQDSWAQACLGEREMGGGCARNQRSVRKTVRPGVKRGGEEAMMIIAQGRGVNEGEQLRDRGKKWGAETLSCAKTNRFERISGGRGGKNGKLGDWRNLQSAEAAYCPWSGCAGPLQDASLRPSIL